MWLGGLHGCNDWAGRTGRSGFSGGLLWTGRTSEVRKPGRSGLGRTGGLRDWRMQWTTESWTRRTGADGAGWGRLERTGRTKGLADAADAADYRILDGADCGRRGGLRNRGWGGWGGWGERGGRGCIGSSLEGR